MGSTDQTIGHLKRRIQVLETKLAARDAKLDAIQRVMLQDMPGYYPVMTDQHDG